MPTWLSSVLISVAASIATVLVIGLTVGPRLTARGKRIQAAHDSRDRLNDSVLDILAFCGNLETITIPAEVSDPLRSRLQGDRDRWLSQIDDTTIWLIDHWQQIALGYVRARGIGDLVAQYIFNARMLWLSNRPLDERVRLLKELTEPVQTIYFARRWRVVSSVPAEITRLRTMIGTLQSDAAPE